jgi:nitroreductase
MEAAMDFREIVLKNRSYRRFDAGKKMDRQTLVDLVDLARQTPSAGNLQPLRYIVSCTKETNEKVFNSLGWAGYLPDWPGPSEEERPTGYIVLLTDNEISSGWAGTDAGIAAQTILLAAAAQGLGGVMFGNIRKKQLRESLAIPNDFEIFLVIAIGTPVEKVILEDLGDDGSVKYHRDSDGTHFVPKRILDDVIIEV